MSVSSVCLKQCLFICHTRSSRHTSPACASSFVIHIVVFSAARHIALPRNLDIYMADPPLIYDVHSCHSHVACSSSGPQRISALALKASLPEGLCVQLSRLPAVIRQSSTKGRTTAASSACASSSSCCDDLSGCSAAAARGSSAPASHSRASRVLLNLPAATD